MDLIRLENLGKYYKSGTGVSRGIQKVNLSFNLNEFVVVAGESGGGKTTLLNVVAGLDTFEEGEMYFNGEATSSFRTTDWERYRANYVGFVFQNYNIIDSLSVYQNVLLALEVQNYNKKERRTRALDIIKEVGLYNRRNNRAVKLSGGEKQRLSIARALAKDTKVLVCDEPTGNLDSETGKQIIDLIKKVSVGKLVIIVSHNVEQVRSHATKIITIHDGLVHEVQTLKEVRPEVIDLKEIPHKKNIPGLLSLALRTSIQAPKRFIFNLFFHTVVAFVLVYLLTNSIYSINSSANLMAMNNIPPNRLLLEKRDGSSFSEFELTELSNYEHVVGVYTDLDRFDLFDIQGNYGGGYLDTPNSIISHFLEGRLPLNNQEIVVSPYFNYEQMRIGNIVKIRTTMTGTLYENFTVVGIYHNDTSGVVYLNESLLVDNSVDYNNTTQIYLIGNTPIHTKEMIAKLNNSYDNLRVIYPYESGSFFEFNQLFDFFQLVLQILLIFAFGSFLFSLLFTITKNTMATKRKDIAILRSIGYTKSDMGLVTLFEQLYLFVISVIFAFIGLYLISINNYSFHLAFNYLSIGSYILIILVLLFLTVRLSNKYNHRLFNLSIIENLVQVGEEV